MGRSTTSMRSLRVKSAVAPGRMSTSTGRPGAAAVASDSSTRSTSARRKVHVPSATRTVISRSDWATSMPCSAGTRSPVAAAPGKWMASVMVETPICSRFARTPERALDHIACGVAHGPDREIYRGSGTPELRAGTASAERFSVRCRGRARNHMAIVRAAHPPAGIARKWRASALRAQSDPDEFHKGADAGPRSALPAPWTGIAWDVRARATRRDR